MVDVLPSETISETHFYIIDLLSRTSLPAALTNVHLLSDAVLTLQSIDCTHGRAGAFHSPHTYENISLPFSHRNGILGRYLATGDA